MSTFLFNETIFGPVKSRRLGISLGINLLPNSRKICTFNCIYCECGWTLNTNPNEKLPTTKEVKLLLEGKLRKMKSHNQKLDVITFAGNGEPTMHPGFAEIIDITISLRNKYYPETKISVLSNSSLVHKKEVFVALNKIDLNILKIDSAFEDTCKLLNNPVGHFSLNELVKNLLLFKGNLIIQTMFLKGNYKGIIVDNSTEKETGEWLKVIKLINPLKVMIYTLDRETAAKGLEKVPLKKLNEIAKKVEELGIAVSVSD